MSSELPSIDFDTIRLLNGSRRDGFEELGTQIFFGEYDGMGESFRIEGAGGDGGVEAYILCPSSGKFGFQSKFFDKLEETQWRQMTKSVKSAVKNHPELKQYVFAVPRNRTPGQIQKWNRLVTGWKAYVKSQNIPHEIDFIWWGYSELATHLLKARYQNQLIYWFGVPDFNEAWIDKFNAASISQLDKRYSPKQHVDTIAGRKLEAFAWGDSSKKKVIAKFLEVSEGWRKLKASLGRKDFTEVDTAGLYKKHDDAMGQFASFRWPLSGFPPLRSLLADAQQALKSGEKLGWDLRRVNDEEKQRQRGVGKPRNSWENGPFDCIIIELRRLGETIDALADLLQEYKHADDFRLVLTGEAGSGKSHLIADTLEAARKRGQPALLLLGERFLAGEEPWSQATRILGWNRSAENLLAALDQAALLCGRPALIFIDALNESDHRKLWISHLIQFASRIDSFPRVKLLVSCRKDFLGITLPDSILTPESNRWPLVDHRGFGAEVIEAIEIYFKAYRVSTNHFPPALAEFRNPLFLRVFCEAFEGRQLPNGPLTLKVVMRARIDRLCELLEKEIDCDPADTRGALRIVAKALADSGGMPVSRDEVRSRVNHLSPAKGASESLYRRLVSNGMLVEIACISSSDQDENSVTVRFPFERFSDYFIAAEILDGCDTEESFRGLFSDGGILANISQGYSYWENRGVLKALAILVPEKFQIELAEFITYSGLRRAVLEDLIASFPWRGADSFTAATTELIAECSDFGIEVLEGFLRTSMIPDHPYNAEYLCRNLRGMSLPDREEEWTIPISDMSGSGWLPSEIVDWCFRAPGHLISDEQSILVGRLLIWFCSSNHRALRRRATLAAIRVLAGRPLVMKSLIEDLHDVNDPYVTETLYAVAAGVAMREPASEMLGVLAGVIHSVIFAQDQVTPNILVRDYARNVLEVANDRACLLEGIGLDSFRPPYNSTWPLIFSEDEVKSIEDDDGWSTIVSSVRPEGMGHYGNFGRYVMGYKVHHFSNKGRIDNAPEPDDRSRFPDVVARRWVLQRIRQLGWTPERFSEYESRIPHGHYDVSTEKLKFERISKKYQWIALRELQGYLSDHYSLAISWEETRPVYQGAWQIAARELDPSQRLVDHDESEPDPPENEYPWLAEYPDPFQNPRLCSNRDAWVVNPPDDFASLINPKLATPDVDHEWVVLAGHYEWTESEYDRVAANLRGKLKLWVNIRSFLVPKRKVGQFRKEIENRNFYGHGVGHPEIRDCWIGEYPWSLALNELKEECEYQDSILGNITTPYHIAICEWSGGGGVLLPSPYLIELLQVEWSGDGGAFRNAEGELVVGHLGGESSDWARPCVVRADLLAKSLEENGLEIVWCAVAEKSCWCSETTTHITKKELEISAIYTRGKRGVSGGITKVVVHDFSGRSGVYSTLDS